MRVVRTPFSFQYQTVVAAVELGGQVTRDADDERFGFLLSFLLADVNKIDILLVDRVIARRESNRLKQPS